MDRSILCEKCHKRPYCKKPCGDVEKILKAENIVMERHYSDKIVCYPRRGEVHFAELPEGMLDEVPADDAIEFSSADLRLRKTAVFVDRFFNKVPCKDLADKFGVKENTIVCMYRQAIEQVQKLIEAMDGRNEGLKAVKKADRFNERQKWFLLACVFGFSANEVADMFGRNRKHVSATVKNMADKHGEALRSVQA